MKPAAAEVRNIGFSYNDRVTIDDVSFTVNEGEYFIIIGPNGSGKTTCLNCINGIYKPEAGDIRFKGRTITGKSPHAIAKLGIGRTFQIPRVFKRVSIQDNLMASVLDSMLCTAIGELVARSPQQGIADLWCDDKPV